MFYSLIGWVCCSVENKQAVVHAAVARGFSGFAVRRMVETFERFLHGLGLYFYVFGVHIKRQRWIAVLERIGIYERYATAGMHHWFRRRLR